MSIQITCYARKTLPKFLIFVLLTALTTLPPPQPARAEPFFIVSSTADVAYVGDPTRLTNGVCETAPGSGVCTLRAAIMKANHYPGGGVTISLGSGTYQLDIAKAGADDETTGDLNISNSMTVFGLISSGTIIQGGGVSNDRVFHVMAGTLSLRRVTIQNGNCGTSCRGGGILVDFGSALALYNSLVNSNTADGAGGGIASLGSLTLNYSSVTGNHGPLGTGIYTSGDVSLTNSTIDGNFGDGLDVVCFESGTRRIYNSTVSNNIGGGVANFCGVSVGGSLIMINSTVFGNGSGGNGGGILNGDIHRDPSTTSLYNVTIAYNSAGTNQAGGGVYNASGTVNFRNTIISNNVHVTNSPPFYANDDCGGGTLTSYDYNLISDTTGCAIGGSISNNKPNIDPNSGIFQNNGGATQTLPLLAESPAIDAGNPGGCWDDQFVTLTTDQRGAARPVNGGIALRCDIGAYEYEAKIPQSIGFDALANKTFGDPPFTVSATASSGLVVTFTAAGQCNVSGPSVTLTGAGSCTVTAHQAGNSNYNAAPDVPRSFTIFAKLYLPLIVR